MKQKMCVQAWEHGNAKCVHVEKQQFYYRCLKISWSVPWGTPVLGLNGKPQAKTDPIGTVLSVPWSAQRPLLKFHQWTLSLFLWTLIILHTQKSCVSSSESARTAAHSPGAKLNH